MQSAMQMFVARFASKDPRILLVVPRTFAALQIRGSFAYGSG
jgi:hypothetical protein